MNRAAELALGSLVPSLSSLPAELVDLAISLLAQSRSKAASLKQEEEVARSYACAHLACERLKTSLNLPAINARPPCPPRIYKKLYAYLESALKSQPSQRPKAEELQTVPSSRTPKRTRSTAENQAPSKRARRDDDRSAENGDNVKQTGYEDRDLRKFLPAVRRVCHAFGDRKAVPHVYAGLCSVLGRDARLHNRADTVHEVDNFEPAKTPATIIAIATLVFEKLDIEVPENAQATALQDACEHTGLAKITGIDLQNPTELDSVLNDIPNLISHGRDVWRDMEWLQNITNPTVPEGHASADGSRASATEQDDLLTVAASSKASLRMGEPGRAGGNDFLRPGLGTMFCDAVDWLSIERRERYAAWKHQVLARIEKA